VASKDKVRHAKLIANPGAGKAVGLSKNLKLAVKRLEQSGLKVDVALAKPKEEATRIAEKAVEDGYKVVIAMGGDGTVEAVMRGLIRSKASLGILPFGTENNVAKSLGIPGKLEEACDLIGENNSRKVDVGQVKVKKRRKTYFFELTVVGLAAALYPPANKLLKGQLSKIKDAAETLIHQNGNSKVFMKLDDESRIETETMLVVVSNTPIFGKNFLVAPNASLDDGLLDISVYPNFSKAELITYFASVMNEGYSENGKVQHYRVRRLELKTSPALAVNADGISLGTGDVKVKCRPAAIRVFAPEPTAAPNAVEKEPAIELPPPVSPPVAALGKPVPAGSRQKEK
jgi:diacylglycerol kinase (ATP)